MYVNKEEINLYKYNKEEEEFYDIKGKVLNH